MIMRNSNKLTLLFNKLKFLTNTFKSLIVVFLY
jgi:hypothetical protein